MNVYEQLNLQSFLFLIELQTSKQFFQHKTFLDATYMIQWQNCVKMNILHKLFLYY